MSGILHLPDHDRKEGIHEWYEGAAHPITQFVWDHQPINSTDGHNEYLISAKDQESHIA